MSATTNFENSASGAFDTSNGVVSENKRSESPAGGKFDTSGRGVSENKRCESSASGEFDTLNGAVSEIHRCEPPSNPELPRISEFWNKGPLSRHSSKSDTNDSNAVWLLKSAGFLNPPSAEFPLFQGETGREQRKAGASGGGVGGGEVLCGSGEDNSTTDAFLADSRCNPAARTWGMPSRPPDS